MRTKNIVKKMETIRRPCANTCVKDLPLTEYSLNVKLYGFFGQDAGSF